MNGERGHRDTVEEEVAQLIALAHSRPDGFRYPDVHESLGWPYEHFLKRVQQARDTLAQTDEMLACRPTGTRGPWVYYLTTEQEPLHVWAKNRTRDAERRFRTFYSLVQSAVKATNPRSREGKKARLMLKWCGRFIEDLGDMREEAAL